MLITFECTGCELNCHCTNIPWWGNRCLLDRIPEGCFKGEDNGIEDSRK